MTGAWTLPRCAVLDGQEYEIHTDYRDILEVLRWLSGGADPQLMDWQQDAPLIAAGIRQAAGCDVRSLPYLHWWSFLACFDAIGQGSFATVVAIRDKLRRGKRLEAWELEFYRTHRAAVELRRPDTAEADAEKQRLLALLRGETEGVCQKT